MNRQSGIVSLKRDSGLFKKCLQMIVTMALRQSTVQIVHTVTVFAMLSFGIACQPTVEPKIPQAETTPLTQDRERSSVAASTEGHTTAHADLPASVKPETGEYLGRQACAKCHAEISVTYDSHPMSRSMSTVEETEVIKTGKHVSFDPPGPCRYVVARDDQGLKQTEEFVDLSGEIVYRDTVPVHYAVGSGQRGLSFITDRHGPLTMGVATWYSTKNVWDLSPGYSPSGHARFGRRVADGCVSCHVARTNSIPGEHNRFETPPFAELSIGCERCHGPGKEHVAFHTLETRPTTPDPIVNPGSLGFTQQLSICYQCHLHGEERIVRSGRSEYDFRPGEQLSDVWVAFVNGSGIQTDGSTAAVSQVEQMHVSRCFVESDGRMTCTSCHDPHLSPSPQERVEFYRSQCLACHEKTDSECRMAKPERLQQVPDDSCIQCHMPALNAGDVPHTAQTDHRVLRVPSAAAPEVAKGVPTIFEPTLFPVPEAAQRRARGILMANKAENEQNISAAATAILLLDPLAGENEKDVPVFEALATCLAMTGDHNSARTLLTKAVRLAPQNEHVLRLLVMNSGARDNFVEALRYLDRVEALYPDDGTVLLQRVRVLSQLGRRTEAFTAARKSVELLPNDFGARVAVIRLATELGMQDVANEQQAILDRMQSAAAKAFPETIPDQTDGR